MSSTQGTRVRFALGCLLVLLCLVLYGPGLETGFLADDLFQISMIEGRLDPRSPFDLYAFAKSDPQAIHGHWQRGSLPWWTVESFRFAMLRPLASVLLWLDHALFGRMAWIHHLHSMVWFFAALGVAYRFLTRILGPWVALAAVGLWAIDETMVWMVAWLANRCALVCVVFALVALQLHLRSARGRGRSAWLEAGAWVLAFGGGEYALCGVAYVVAYELVGARDGWRDRVRALWPALAATGLFALGWMIGGYGVYGANTYVDPVHDFVPFVESSGHRILRMLGEVWLNLAGEGERFSYRYGDSGLAGWVIPEDGSDLVAQAWRHARFSAGLTVAVLATGWWLARPLLRPEERRHLGWLVLGSTLSLVPLAAVPPATRALVFPNLAAAVVVAVGAAAALRGWGQGRGRARAVIMSGWALAMVYIHGIREARYADEQLDALLGAQAAYAAFYGNPAFAELDIEGKHVVVIATPGLVTGIHGSSMLAVLGQEPPASWHVMAMGQRPYLVRRIGNRSLELDAVGGPLHRSPQESLFRAHDDALRPGDRVDAGLFEAEVLHERPGEGPDAVLFRFDLPLEDPDLVFLQVGPQGLAPFDLPPEAETVALRPPELPSVIPRG